jgi:hypothetical protein
MLADPERDVLILPLTCMSATAALDRRRQARPAAGYPFVRLASAVDGLQRPSVPNTCQSFG